MNMQAVNANPTAESAGTSSREALGSWLYAITYGTADESQLADGVGGVAGELVRRIDAQGLTALVGTVDLRDFGEEALRRRLEDLDWLAVAARAHDRVVNEIARHVPTVPVGFATVFCGDDNVRALLEARHSEFSAALRRLEGRTEWGVKAYADAGSDPGSGTARGEPRADPAREGAGTAFLNRRRAQLAAQQSAAQSAAEQADRIHARLARLSVGSRRYAPQNPALTGRRDRMLLNGAYLVDDARLAVFRSVLSAIDSEGRGQGVHVELTGPWPAYSFTAAFETQEPADG